jgi:hypothetical protein
VTQKNHSHNLPETLCASNSLLNLWDVYPDELEQDQNSRAQEKGLQGGLYIRPGDEDLSQGTPERKKPSAGVAVSKAILVPL